MGMRSWRGSHPRRVNGGAPPVTALPERNERGDPVNERDGWCEGLSVPEQRVFERAARARAQRGAMRRVLEKNRGADPFWAHPNFPCAKIAALRNRDGGFRRGLGDD